MAPGDQLERVRAFTREIEFDFIGWTSDALRLKLSEAALGTNRYLGDDDRREFVLEYLDLVRIIQRQEAELEQIYADPKIGNPRAYSAALRKELDELNARREQTGPLAESILQSQISTIVSELGLTLGGQPLPPVLYHSTPLPLILIISPRDVIRQDESIALEGGLSIDQRIELEERVDRALNVSSLVENIGGLGLYPTMVVESSSLDWLSEVVSHEWVHNYLTLRPLGINYETSPELRVLNETVASIAGKEIGRAVLERYYPELVPPEPPQTSEEMEQEQVTGQPPAFDFRKEMQKTRVTADRSAG